MVVESLAKFSSTLLRIPGPLTGIRSPGATDGRVSLWGSIYQKKGRRHPPHQNVSTTRVYVDF